MPNEYWLISVPGLENGERLPVLEKVKGQMSANALVKEFVIPSPKVGTLDALVGHSDELVRLDSFIDNLCHSISNSLTDVLEITTKEEMEENLLAAGNSLSSYVTKFTWSASKYGVRNAIKTMINTIHLQCSQIEADFKTRIQQYNSLRQERLAIERKQTGTLVGRSLNEIVKKEDFVLGYDYLKTVLVIVPKISEKEFLEQYEHLGEMDQVVPRTAKHLYNDQENSLFAVIVFNIGHDDKNSVTNFKRACREKKYMIREYEFNEKSHLEDLNRKSKLENDISKAHGPLIRFLKMSFSESFISWMHIKALRLFVESVLRFGLPENFVTMVIVPVKNKNKKCLDVLNQLFGNINTLPHQTSTNKDSDMMKSLPGLMGNLTTEDYYPFIYLPLTLEYVRLK
ncbi:hypothetical protein SNEBB_001654 [Seison nebaliae]|nr:hypothetical protein SNEBB_001654 [Seison nebaliae]